MYFCQLFISFEFYDKYIIVSIFSGNKIDILLFTTNNFNKNTFLWILVVLMIKNYFVLKFYYEISNYIDFNNSRYIIYF